MPIRVECSTPGLEENWIEVDEVWTRRELREYMSLKGEPFIALWQRKVTACHLVTGDVVVDEPAQVHGLLDELDLRLTRFVTEAVLEATDYLLSLGEVNKRLSLPGVGEAAMTKMMTAPAKPNAVTA